MGLKLQLALMYICALKTQNFGGPTLNFFSLFDVPVDISSGERWGSMVENGWRKSFSWPPIAYKLFQADVRHNTDLHPPRECAIPALEM